MARRLGQGEDKDQGEDDAGQPEDQVDQPPAMQIADQRHMDRRERGDIAEQQPTEDERARLPYRDRDIVDAEGARHAVRGHEIGDQRGGGRPLHRLARTDDTAEDEESGEALREPAQGRAEAPHRERARQDEGTPRPIRYARHRQADAHIDHRISEPHQQADLRVAHAGIVFNRDDQQRHDAAIELAEHRDERDDADAVPAEPRREPRMIGGPGSYGCGRLGRAGACEIGSGTGAAGDGIDLHLTSPHAPRAASPRISPEEVGSRLKSRRNTGAGAVHRDYQSAAGAHAVRRCPTSLS
jgi:hypothetical protein